MRLDLSFELAREHAQIAAFPQVSNNLSSPKVKVRPLDFDLVSGLSVAVEQANGHRAILQRASPDFQVAVLGDAIRRFAERVLVQGEDFPIG